MADIAPLVSLNGNMTFTASLNGELVMPEKVWMQGPLYCGDYSAEPKLYENVILQTKGMTLTQNITVLKIPQYEVSNEAGGKTLILGGE